MIGGFVIGTFFGCCVTAIAIALYIDSQLKQYPRGWDDDDD